MSDLVKIKRALVSVFSKEGLETLGQTLHEHGVTILSTGGTANALRNAGVPVTDVSEVTKFPEMMGGRVKSLHPAIHAGLLAVRSDESHMQQLQDQGFEPIDLVVSNLYPFEQTVASGKTFAECIEMIDIGGPTMVRSAAKNCASVTVVTSPSQYAALLAELKASGGCVSSKTRQQFARDAFRSTAKYDAAVTAYFSAQTDGPAVTFREYEQALPLKYGVNPHQKPAACHAVQGGEMPFDVVNGAPGYTNLMDALNAWQLVRELEQATGLVAAASFKHVSPAGAAIAEPLSDELKEIYDVAGRDLSPLAIAYIRARNADPLSSYGDFAALSGVVDVCTAELIKREVSDGVIALGFEPAALEILKSKKEGKYIVLQGKPDFKPPSDEFKEVYGVGLSQKRNDACISKELLAKVVTKESLPDSAARDLIIATITAKYTQSNSVCFAVDGQVVGVGAGQQNRVDCVKLAGRKVSVWHARLSPKVRNLAFKPSVKRQERVNARVAYIGGSMTDNERTHWEQLFESVPEALTEKDLQDWNSKLSGVSLSSDAFFPFRDNIDQATKFGTKYIAQPGGSIQDQDVIAACDEYGIAMCFTGLRVFHH
eukprot:m.105913 g.105913  ORF g.105913 m.105913 type:complete len:599 (+) comp18965_c0_seq1:108-1904(+)